MKEPRQILRDAAGLLVAEGYTKDSYAIESRCGTKRCLIGALEAAARRDHRIGTFCTSDVWPVHVARLKHRNKPLVAAYRALEDAAVKHTQRRGFASDDSGQAESYSEADNTTRADVIRLLKIAEDYLPAETV